ncbi:MAG: sensor domain-containing protein [Bacillota bacterium]
MEYLPEMTLSILHNMLNGFAYHQIITNGDGKPIDFCYIDVNPAFEKMTGLTKENILGKRVTEVIPGINASNFNWFETFGEVALKGKSISFDQYFEPFNKWYSINVFSPKKGYFITIFSDITSLKKTNLSLEDKNNNLNSLFEEMNALEEELRQQVDELSFQRDKLRESEERLNRAQSLAHVGSWELDLTTGLIWGSEEAFRIYGLPRVSPYLPLLQVQEQVDIKDRLVMDEALKDLLEKDSKYDIEFTIARQNDGEKRIIHSRAEAAHDDTNNPSKVLGAIQDITEHKLADLSVLKKNEELTALYEELLATEEELRVQYEALAEVNEKLKNSEERYKVASEGANDGIWDWDISNDFLFVSQRFKELVGLENTIIAKPNDIIKEMIFPDHYHYTIENLTKHLQGETDFFSSELKILTSCGEYKWFLCRGKALKDKEGKAYRMAGSLTDISEVKKHHEVIHNLAYYDLLTGLPNKVLFQDRLNMAINYARRNNKKIALIFFDADNFKNINDTLGHFIGDQVINEAGKILKSSIRDYDTLARLGGDEFVVTITDIKSLNELVRLTERIKNSFSNPIIINDNSIYITFSMGVSIYPDDGEDIVELLKNADTAMYKAKELGKNNTQFYDKEMKAQILRKIEVENNLRNAVEKGELFLTYQPCINLKDKSIKGFEALLRWNSGNLGFIKPLDFIPLAEETGMIIKIGKWVLENACMQNKLWHDLYNIKTVISINISPIQLKDRNFLSIIRRTLEKTGLNPEYLELEITENILIDSVDLTIKKLEKLRKLGVRISLDDFGTGFSSLKYLKKLPLNTVKIDKSFIDDINTKSHKPLLVGSIISIAHLMGLQVIVEGVETKVQLDYLLNENCDGIQGFLFSKPVVGEEVPLLIKNFVFDQ